MRQIPLVPWRTGKLCCDSNPSCCNHGPQSHLFLHPWSLWHELSARPVGRCDMRSSRIITDYHKNQAFSQVKCIWRYV